MRLCQRTASRLAPRTSLATVTIVITIIIDPILGRFAPRIEVAVVFFAAIYGFAGNTESQ